MVEAGKAVPLEETSGETSGATSKTRERSGPLNITRAGTTVEDILDRELQQVTSLGTGLAAFRENGLGPYAYPTSYADHTDVPAADKIATAEAVRALTGHTLETHVSIPITDSDANAFERKRKLLERAKFDQWFAGFFEHALPAEKELLRRIYPQYFEEKIKANKDIHEFQTELARISIMGPQNIADIVKLYALSEDQATQEMVRRGAGPISQEPKVAMESYKQGIWASRPWQISRTKDAAALGKAAENNPEEAGGRYAKEPRDPSAGTKAAFYRL
jgi:hypothetical protein